MAKTSCLSIVRSVEPVVFLYAFGLLIHSPLIQQYVYDRVSEDKGYENTVNSRTECANDSDLHDEVESKTSFYMFGLIVFSSAPSLVMALLLGSWSDKVGRKPAICLPCFGAAVDMSLTLIVIYFDLPLYVLFAGSFFNGMTGYFPAMVLATMAYISDTTDESMRAIKLGILEFFIFIGGTIGQAFSGKIIESDNGYTAPYWIVCGCMTTATLYAIFLMPETLAKENRDTSAKFFDRKHFNAILNVVRKKPGKNSSTLRWLIALNFFLHLSYFGSYAVTILFLLDKPLCWSPLDIGLFCSERFFCLGIGAVIGVKFLSKFFRKKHIIYFGLLTYTASLVLFAFADTTALVCSVPVVGMFIGAVIAYFRSMMSQQASPDQQGSLFAAIGFVDALATVCSSGIFNLLYPLSLKFDFNGTSFLVAAVFALVVLYLTTRLSDNVMDTPAEIVEYDGEAVDEKTPLLLSDVHSTYSGVKT